MLTHCRPGPSVHCNAAFAQFSALKTCYPDFVMAWPPSLGAFSDTVEAIHDCALNPQRWRDTLRLVGQLTDTPIIAIGIMDYDQERLV
jgi:hypothetical protein